MSLILVPTPIGHSQDLSFRAKEVLSQAEVIIVEEFKESSQWLRAHGIQGKKLERLNEHTTPEEKRQLFELCRTQEVPLITDCGTPGFCDPGADLVRLCRDNGVPVKALPGPSSLMTLLSLSSRRLDEFVFRGFLPAENQARAQAWEQLSKEKRALVLMDTPYRFEKMLQELERYFPQRDLLVATQLTQENELVLEGRAAQIKSKFPERKVEFMILVYPLGA